MQPPASTTLMTHDGAVAGLLDALPDATAILGPSGSILAVNRAWRMFALDNRGSAESTGIGVNYLDVCRRSAAAGCEDADAVATGLRAVLAGHTVESDYEYPCPSPAIGRWFVLRMTAIERPEKGVLVSHGNITRRKIAEQDLERRASRDPLTSLANRGLFIERATTALAPRPTDSTQPDVGLLYIDLDGFKPVNDTYGHAAGDEVLQAVARRLQLVNRSSATVARLGGDEFAVVEPRITGAGLAAVVARVRDALGEPYLVHGNLVTVGASVGTYLATAGEHVTDCLDRADKSMYDVKRARPRDG
jgi:diguanylate cyclase (GGDEF)-like protein